MTLQQNNKTLIKLKLQLMPLPKQKNHPQHPLHQKKIYIYNNKVKKLVFCF